VITHRVASIQIASADELHVVIGLIFQKALAEPHYCETYADMVLALKQCMPEFPSPNGGKPITFKAALLNTTQSEFEALSQILTVTPEEAKGMQIEEIDALKKKRRDRARANMRFIGQLFLRALLGSRIIESIIKDLSKANDATAVPEESIVECLCELLQNTGYTLECSGEAGKASLSKVCEKLDAIKGMYCKRIQFGIQDVLDIRSQGWKKKTFKASAKTKGEIRREQEQDLWAQACGREVPTAEVQIAGARRPVAGW
jgi:translation initiation factor 4G